eukprot:1881713-Alexandrium_andersonii.AAC.1
MAAHGSVLRKVAAKTGRHFSGLFAASKYLHGNSNASSRLLRRMRNLDTAAAVVRHITDISVDSMLADVDALMVVGLLDSDTRAAEQFEFASVASHDLEDVYACDFTMLVDDAHVEKPMSDLELITKAFT